MADKGVMGRSPGIIRCNIRRVGTGYNLYETGIRGIWDEVSITTTGPVCLSSPYVVTKVPGVRDPETKTQKEAFVNTSVELENTGSTSLKGLLVCETNGTRLTQPVTLSPFEKKTVSLNPLAVKNPRFMVA